MPVVLEEFGLACYFKEIIESSVVGIRKPDPALFALGVEALLLPAEEIVVIGDSYRKDIYPSSTLGCRTIWIKNICWEEEPVIDGHAPTATIGSIEQVPDIITDIVSKEP
jgi:putative hydrolase of the HAD superfamily